MYKARRTSLSQLSLETCDSHPCGPLAWEHHREDAWYIHRGKISSSPKVIYTELVAIYIPPREPPTRASLLTRELGSIPTAHVEFTEGVEPWKRRFTTSSEHPRKPYMPNPADDSYHVHAAVPCTYSPLWLPPRLLSLKVILC